MKKSLHIYLVLLLCTLTTTTKAQPTPPNGKKWVAVASLTDEFNSTSLDRSKWMPKHPYWAGRSPSLFLESNVSVAGGNLRLKSTVKNYNQQGDWVWASCVTSNTKAMKKGYYSEARIKCSMLSMTTAFWFQGSKTEIDVIENFGAPTSPRYLNHNRNMKTNTHYFPNGWGSDQSTPWESNNLFPTVGQTYYTYGVWWKDSRTMIFYLNGQPVRTTITVGNFDEDEYMFFDTETFTWGIGLPTLASLQDNNKNTGLIDWVHTYKLEDSNGGSDTAIIPNGTYYIESTLSTQHMASRPLEQYKTKMFNAGNYNDQKWNFVHLGNNVYTIQNKETGRYLEVPFAQCANAAIASTFTIAIDNHQKWKVVANGAGVYGFKPLHCTSQGLDISAGALNAFVQTWQYSASNNNQKFKILPAGVNGRINETVTNRQANDIKIFPNPVADNVVISGLTTGEYVVISNQFGKALVQFIAKKHTETISVASLATGIYNVSVSGKNSILMIKE